MHEPTIAVQEGPDRKGRPERDVHSIAEVLDELLAHYFGPVASAHAGGCRKAETLPDPALALRW